MNGKSDKLIWAAVSVLIIGFAIAFLYSNTRLSQAECERDAYSDALDEANNAIEDTASQINEVQIAGDFNELKIAVDGLHQPENVGINLSSCHTN